MRNGPLVVAGLILAAAVGAWLGPAGGRTDPQTLASEAWFRLALSRQAYQGIVYLSVAGQAPSPELMARFGGDLRPLSAGSEPGARLDLAELSWHASGDRVRGRGSWSEPGRPSVPLDFGLARGPRGKWEPAASPP